MPRKAPAESDFNARFMDVNDAWMAAERLGGVELECETHGKAVAKLHRMNYCRKIARANSPWHKWDAYVARVEETSVIVRPRATLDLSCLKTLDGRPITWADIHVDDVEAQVALTHAPGFRDGEPSGTVTLDPMKPLLDDME